MNRLILLLATLLLILFVSGCSCGSDDDAKATTDAADDDDNVIVDDDAADDDIATDDDIDDDAIDDDVSDDDITDDDAIDDDAIDDDTVDDDTADDDVTGDSSPSFNFGITHFHYYGDLGEEVFEADSAWAAANVELAIIGQSDSEAQEIWQELRSDQPRGKWLNWQVGHLFNTHETAGTCEEPQLGGPDQSYAERMAEFSAFLVEYPQYEDGEDCFLHARYDGQMQARWHAAGCNVTLDQIGYEGSAGSMEQARIQTLVWDEYAWLVNMAGDCGRDYQAWRAARAVANDGFGGVGFDNIGSPLDDGYYLPTPIDTIDIMEIDDAVEADPDLLDEWYFDAVGGFLTAVRDGLINEDADAVAVFNGGSYCSWDGSVPLMESLCGENIGVWCENALQYPQWGNLDTPERIEALIDLSERLAVIDSFVALETFYSSGTQDPTPAEVMYYLAAFYIFQKPADVFILKPDWSPYAPLQEATWFPIFRRDIGTPLAAAEKHSHGIFTRQFQREDEQITMVLVRADSANGPEEFELDGDYCRVDADNSTSEVSGTISVSSGDGLVLMEKGEGGC